MKWIKDYVRAVRAAREAGHGPAIACALVPAFIIGQAAVILTLLYRH